MRIISFSDFHASSSPIYKELKILRLKVFITLQNCLFVYDFFHNKLPVCFNDYLQSVKRVHSIGTKSNKLGCIFISRVSITRYGLNLKYLQLELLFQIFWLQFIQASTLRFEKQAYMNSKRKISVGSSRVLTFVNTLLGPWVGDPLKFFS